METILVEIESDTKAKELTSILSSMSFVKKVSTLSTPKALLAALQEHEGMKEATVKKKNKAIAKHL